MREREGTLPMVEGEQTKEELLLGEMFFAIDFLTFCRQGKVRPLDAEEKVYKYSAKGDLTEMKLFFQVPDKVPVLIPSANTPSNSEDASKRKEKEKKGIESLHF